MLDAHADIQSPQRPGLGYDDSGVDDRDGVGGNPWGDAGTGSPGNMSTSFDPSRDPERISITPTTPRGPAYQGFGYTNGSASATASCTTTSLSMHSSSAHSVKSGSGLRSRKVSASQHRRVSSLNGNGPPLRSGSGSASNSGSRSGSVSAHPLSSTAALAPASGSMRRIASSSLTMLDGTITRPALKRRLGSDCEFYCDDLERESSEGDLWVNVNGGDSGQKMVRGEAETMVIVHEVTRTDSIAGVALKYGISLADLRRANHLWASDSIHLRKVLYIPLHLSSKKDLYYPSNTVDEVDVNGASHAESSSIARSRSSVVIQRVPLSQLAFFPPSSQPFLSPDSERKRGLLPSPFQGTGPSPSPSPSPRRVQSASEGSDTTRLSALLQALPFPLALASGKTRRESFSLRFPRFSGDWSESSMNVSETSSELDRQEHEMDVLGVGTGTSRRGRREEDRDRGTVRKKGKERYHRESTASIETLKKAGYVPTEPEGDVPLVPLQTEQLKPSPMMQLPRSLRRDGG